MSKAEVRWLGQFEDGRFGRLHFLTKEACDEQYDTVDGYVGAVRFKQYDYVNEEKNNEKVTTSCNACTGCSCTG